MDDNNDKRLYDVENWSPQVTSYLWITEPRPSTGISCMISLRKYPGKITEVVGYASQIQNIA